MDNRATNPMSEYLLKIQLIITNSEFKDKSIAKKYETLESKLAGDAYVRAIKGDDLFDSYVYDKGLLYSVLSDAGYDENRIFKMIADPILIPQSQKEKLTVIGRKLYLQTYKETNKYYMDLMGKPLDKSDEVLMPDEFYMIYENDNTLQRGMPIHEMPYKYQELFINSKYYQDILEKYPDLEYLKHIGSYAIPLEVSRPAKDGEIIHINTNKLSTYNDIYGNITVESDLIHLFCKVYNETRDYVYNTLRGNFSDIYVNYDSFIRFLTIYLSIGNTLGEVSRKASAMLYMNNVSANNYFMLYGLPSEIMENTNMIKFLKKFRLILMDKGTNKVYRVKDLVGYEQTDIYSLIMVKQQQFRDGVPIYTIDENGEKHPMYKIVFRRSGVADENTSYFKFREQHKEFTLDQITSGDPRWWNGRDVDQMINEMNYTLSNSKYIQLSTHMSAEDIFWQTSILIRGLLDRKQETLYSRVSVNYNIDGKSDMSVFEAVLVLIILMDWMLVDINGKSIKGELYLPNGTYNGYPACVDMLFNGLNEDGSPKDLIEGLPFKITSFNFNLRDTDPAFYESIKYMDYIEPEVFLPMLDNILDMKNNNIGEVLMNDAKALWRYLRDKLINTQTINEFRQVTDVYSHVFLVDPVRTWYTDIPYDVDSILCEEFTITPNELSAYKIFFIDDNVDMNVEYDGDIYPISFYKVLNENVSEMIINGKKPFQDELFVQAFMNVFEYYQCPEITPSTILSSTVKSKYKNIIKSKVILDTGNSENGPKTFDAMLYRMNPVMYNRLTELRKDKNGMTILIRSIIKALESYTNSSLMALQFKTLGEEEYFRTLKAIISYFKSYMVEYTNDEFVYIFGGIFDNGGNSDMLKMFDQIDHARIRAIPKDSLTLFDVSNWKKKLKMADSIELKDEIAIKIRTTYKKILESTYDVWYDDGNWITQKPLPSLTDDTLLEVRVEYRGDSLMVVINKDDIIS